jgi:dolichol-phosphate mannosyltransferase
MSSANETLIFIPTYNERDNVRKLTEELLALGLDADILLMDDNSPDGTGDIIDDLAREHPNVKTIHRKRRMGIGSAHYEGIIWAYDHKYRILVTMDCDFSHSPEYVMDFITEGRNGDVVVGSRYVYKKSLAGWNILRKVLTNTGHFLTTNLLGMKYDATGAFRLYRLDRIPRYAFDVVTSRGYSFFYESLYILFVNGYTIREVAINLPPRTYGSSKMSLSEALRSMELLVKIYFTVLFNREKFSVCEPFVPDKLLEEDKQGWDGYWQAKSTGRFWYGIIAAFYRKYIIKPSLNSFVKKHFRPGSTVLHAGCGSGQVDSDIRHHVSITGLDNSVAALNFYRQVNKDHCRILYGSVFKIPLADSSVDGIYHLGLMEHFLEDDIQRILKEFHRVLRSDGKMIVFWPPEFGLSVIFFKVLKKLLFFKKNVKFHPDEPTRIRSREHAENMFSTANFAVVDYYFGVKDLFTYATIVLQKKQDITAHTPADRESTHPYDAGVEH